MKPYKDQEESNFFIRLFDETADADEYVWHRDRKDRKIEVLEGKGWKFQFDNSLPFNIISGDRLYISSNQFHRLIKGKTPLKIRITENI